MTTTLNSDIYTIYDAKNNPQYSGVVKITSNGYYGTGALLYDGRAILTAAHLFTDPNARTNVIFDLPYKQEILIEAQDITIMPSYDPINSNNDLAIVWLSKHAPVQAQRYEIYRDNDEIGKEFIFSGFGQRGDGLTGFNKTLNIKKLVAKNSFDATANQLKEKFHFLSWNPNNHILIADFDSGNSKNDALNDFLNIKNLGTGKFEALIAPGDSGSPAFIDDKIAGIADYTTSISDYYHHPDINDINDSSFGEMGFWQKVSDFQEFIDKNIRKHYQNQPNSVEDVKRFIKEGNNQDISVTYFYLSINGPKRDSNISVEYTTIDGTAKANEDYIPTKGTIVVYPDEDYVLIPVEIIGDNRIEDNETFFLKIFNPEGATLIGNQTELIAQRTIINDDYFFG